jgi:Uma2 family endonuclease
MASRAHDGLITADDFLRIDWGTDKKAELDDGVIRMMTGGTRSHSRVQANLVRHLGNALEGSGCRPFGSDMGLRVNDTTVRYPDVSIYCGKSFAPEFDNELDGDDPRVIIEILSPSTSRRDLGEKLEEYQGIESVETIVFVEPVGELLRIIGRAGPNGWNDSGFSGKTNLVLTSLNIELRHDLIFARS